MCVGNLKLDWEMGKAPNLVVKGFDSSPACQDERRIKITKEEFEFCIKYKMINYRILSKENEKHLKEFFEKFKDYKGPFRKTDTVRLKKIISLCKDIAGVELIRSNDGLLYKKLEIHTGEFSFDVKELVTDDKISISKR